VYLSKKKGGGGEVKVTNVVWLFDFFNDWQFWLFKFFLIKELSISIISKSKNHQSPIMVFQKHQRANRVSTIIKMIFFAIFK